MNFNAGVCAKRMQIVPDKLEETNRLRDHRIILHTKYTHKKYVHNFVTSGSGLSQSFFNVERKESTLEDSLPNGRDKIK